MADSQEADAKSWSSLKHVKPKEGRKELAPREELSSAIVGLIPQSEREPAVPKRGARESERAKAKAFCATGWVFFSPSDFLASSWLTKKKKKNAKEK